MSTWTPVKPMRPGWYWFTRAGDRDPKIVRVFEDEYGRFRMASGGDGRDRPALRDVKGEWAGPISPPKGGRPEDAVPVSDLQWCTTLHETMHAMHVIEHGEGSSMTLYGRLTGEEWEYAIVRWEDGRLTVIAHFKSGTMLAVPR